MLRCVYDNNELNHKIQSIMSKEYYKKKIIDLRAAIAREKEEKKREKRP